MRALLAFALLLVGLPALADPYQRLYQAAGWPDQRAHFSDALDAAQKRYQDKLPPALYQTLVDNSNRRFAPAEVDQRALNGLRENLPDSASPLNFFESPLGRKVVAAEVLATRRDQLLQHSNGLPRQTASEPRRALVKRLAQVLPAREAGAEVSLALAGVAADSLSQMLPGLPGLLGGGQTGQLLEGQRQRLVQQIGADLENTLLYVYRDLSDAELTQYVNFADARIHGLEGRAEWVMPNGITLKTAMAFTKGSTQNDGAASQPLNTVNPFSAVFGVRYEPTERWFVQTDLLFQAAKRDKDVDKSDCSNKACFTPPSSFVVDLRGGYRFNKHVSATIGIRNLFDRKYWNWSDVRGIAADSQVLDAYSSPGRTVAVSMKVDF